ncbi:hypothetical protein SGPA1_30675 [Streptomyces misionensis JCM 4497]
MPRRSASCERGLSCDDSGPAQGRLGYGPDGVRQGHPDPEGLPAHADDFPDGGDAGGEVAYEGLWPVRQRRQVPGV